tara:strand:+ start:3483 stop:4280 length:798 start_codon:yes stop_codon:yes gene_type:complete
MTVDVIILNRNLKAVTDQLAKHLAKLNGIGGVYVADSGSTDAEISSRTIAREDSEFARINGLRINRGFNLGLLEWLKLDNPSEWVLLLPNDAELVSANLNELLELVGGTSDIAAILPITDDNPYSSLIQDSGASLVWNIHEGPIMLRRNFVVDSVALAGQVFDSSNFRSYASFLDLSFKIYASDRCIVATNLLRFRENKLHQLTKHTLIGTEPQDESLALLLAEGKKWMALKYGFTDRRNLELATRLLFEEFCIVHPEVDIKPAI